MKNENLIPSLLVEDEEETFPKRGGKYVSDQEQRQKEIEENYSILKAQIKSLRCHCYEEPDCNC